MKNNTTFLTNERFPQCLVDPSKVMNAFGLSAGESYLDTLMENLPKEGELSMEEISARGSFLAPTLDVEITESNLLRVISEQGYRGTSERVMNYLSDRTIPQSRWIEFGPHGDYLDPKYTPPSEDPPAAELIYCLFVARMLDVHFTFMKRPPVRWNFVSSTSSIGEDGNPDQIIVNSNFRICFWSELEIRPGSMQRFFPAYAKVL